MYSKSRTVLYLVFLFVNLGIAATPLAERFGTRPVMLLGGVLGSVGLVACAFAGTYLTFLLCYSVAVGTAVAFEVTPAVVVLSHYFKRLLPMATALVLLATPLGSLVRMTPFNASIMYSKDATFSSTCKCKLLYFVFARKVNYYLVYLRFRIPVSLWSLIGRAPSIIYIRLSALEREGEREVRRLNSLLVLVFFLN